MGRQVTCSVWRNEGSKGPNLSSAIKEKLTNKKTAGSCSLSLYGTVMQLNTVFLSTPRTICFSSVQQPPDTQLGEEDAKNYLPISVAVLYNSQAKREGGLISQNEYRASTSQTGRFCPDLTPTCKRTGILKVEGLCERDFCCWP